jgi:hypothetical protein
LLQCLSTVLCLVAGLGEEYWNMKGFQKIWLTANICTCISELYKKISSRVKLEDTKGQPEVTNQSTDKTMAKWKETNYDSQNTTRKTRDWATWISLKQRVNPCVPER